MFITYIEESDNRTQQIEDQDSILENEAGSLTLFLENANDCTIPKEETKSGNLSIKNLISSKDIMDNIPHPEKVKKKYLTKVWDNTAYMLNTSIAQLNEQRNNTDNFRNKGSDPNISQGLR